MNFTDFFTLAVTQGLSLVIALLFVYLVYRYINIKMELMKRQDEASDKKSRFTIKGKVTRMRKENEIHQFIDLEVKELTDKD